VRKIRVVVLGKTSPSWVMAEDLSPYTRRTYWFGLELQLVFPLSAAPLVFALRGMRVNLRADSS
jgi:hypothetical protein